MAAVGAWPVPLALYGRRGGGARPLHPVWTPWGRGSSPESRMAAFGVWPVPCVPYGRRGSVAPPLGPV